VVRLRLDRALVGVARWSKGMFLILNFMFSCTNAEDYE
jgi:hypothetical protein